MARKRKPEEPPGIPSWLTTFGDMMSLLLTFFVLLVAMASFEEREVKEAIFSLRGALGMMPRNMSAIGQADPKNTQTQVPHRMKDIDTRVNRFQKQLKEQGLERQIVIGKQDRGIINIRIPSSVLFRSGSAELLESAHPILEDIAELLGYYLQSYDSDLRIEGHTDDVPISPESRSIFPSNWELSTARATSVMRFLTSRGGLPEDRFCVAGYGPFKPVRRPVDTEANRIRNRRVEIVVIPRKNIEDNSDERDRGEVGIPHEPIPGDDLPEPL